MNAEMYYDDYRSVIEYKENAQLEVISNGEFTDEEKKIAMLYHEQSSYENLKEIHPEIDENKYLSMWISRITNECQGDLIFRDSGIFTHGGDLFLSRNAIKECITELNKALDNYDKLFIDFINNSTEKLQEELDRLKLKTEEKTKDKSGYVYVIKFFDYYKIGKTNNPSRRMGEFTKLPEKPQVILVEKVKDSAGTEKELHQMFADKRLRNGTCEWFDIVDEDIEKIREYLETVKAE